MTYATLIVKNALRSKVRAVLALLSLALPCFLAMILQAALSSMNHFMDRAEKNLRLVVYHKMGWTLDIPESFIAKVARLPGVVAACPFTAAAGTYKDPHTQVAAFSVDASTFRVVWPDGTIRDAEYAAFVSDPRGCIVDGRVAARHGWRPGDRVTLRGTNRPVELDFTVRGILVGSPDPNAFYFHRKYLEEALGLPGLVTSIWMKVRDREALARVQRAAVDGFAAESPPVRVDLEKTIVELHVSLQGNIVAYIGGIGISVIGVILLVAGNTMMLVLRERDRELAVMKVLGFAPRVLVALTLAEAAAVGLCAGVVGSAAGLVFLSSPFALTLFGPLGGLTAALGSGAMRATIGTVILSLLAGVVPAYRAAHVPVSQILTRA